MKLWERLETELNYNTMVSQRGVLNVFHSDAQRDAYARRGNAMRLHGVDAELLDRDKLRKLAPYIELEDVRFPVHGALLQARGGTARHDAVVWGFARAADRLGVDIIQNCEVLGFPHLLWKRSGRGNHARNHPGRQGGNVGRRQQFARWRDGRLEASDREPRHAGICFRRRETSGRSCGHVRRRPFLHQPVRQGRTGVSAATSTATIPTRSAATCLSWKMYVKAACPDAHHRPVAYPAKLGRIGRHVDGWIADHRPYADCRALFECGLELWGFKATPAAGWCFGHLIAATSRIR